VNDYSQKRQSVIIEGDLKPYFEFLILSIELLKMAGTIGAENVFLGFRCAKIQTSDVFLLLGR
jgi:hypothetical protein